MQRPDEAPDLQKCIRRNEQDPRGRAAFAEFAQKIEPQVDDPAVLVSTEQDTAAEPEQDRQQDRACPGRQGEPAELT